MADFHLLSILCRLRGRCAGVADAEQKGRGDDVRRGLRESGRDQRSVLASLGSKDKTPAFLFHTLIDGTVEVLYA